MVFIIINIRERILLCIMVFSRWRRDFATLFPLEEKHFPLEELMYFRQLETTDLPIIRITVAYVDSFVNRIREVELISTYRIPNWWVLYAYLFHSVTRLY